MTVIRTPIQQTGAMGKAVIQTPLVVQQGKNSFHLSVGQIVDDFFKKIHHKLTMLILSFGSVLLWVGGGRHVHPSTLTPNVQ